MGRKRSGARVLGPYQRADGRFALLLKGPPVPGSKGEEWFYFSTLKEANRAKTDMEAGLRSAEAMTLEDAIGEYQDHLRTLGRKESTIEEAGHRLRPLLKIVGGEALVEQLNRRHIEKRLAGLPAVDSRRGTLARICAFCEWAITGGYLRHDPTKDIEVEGLRKKGKPTLTRTEARRLDELLWRSARTGNVEEQEKAVAIIVLLYCALREAELLRLQVRDLDMDSAPAVISVERWGKTRKALRDMEVPGELADLLRARTQGKPLDAWVWPSEDSETGHREKTWILKGVKAFCRAAGVQVICPQGLRATHARLSREAGATAHVIAHQLGHTDTKVTTGSYIGTDADEAQKSRSALKVLQGGRADG